MELTAHIRDIKYKTFLPRELSNFTGDINDAPETFCFDGFAISKWVSPKRTRSYPFARVYDTLSYNKKVAIIPVIKDEGCKGDRDYIQWDTVSLMSLLDVYVIIAYYNDAKPHETKQDKITNQRFARNFIEKQLSNLKTYHSSALHWNRNQLEDVSNTAKLAKEAYAQTSKKLNISLHKPNGIDMFVAKISEDFQKFSRDKAKDAQSREYKTTQPKESLQTSTKAKLTITNMYKGTYYFTCDEYEYKDEIHYLIESKHSKDKEIPSNADIKDGLLKMVLYCNLEGNYKGVFRLTSTKINGKITKKQDLFNHALSELTQATLIKLFDEAEHNGFAVEVLGV
jgi:hypothetical protein